MAGKAPHKERPAAGSQALFPSARTVWGPAPGSPGTPLRLRALAPSVVSHIPPAALPASPLLGALAGPSPSFPVPCPRGVSPCPSLPGAGLRGAPCHGTRGTPAPALCAAREGRTQKEHPCPRVGVAPARLEGALPARAPVPRWGPPPGPVAVAPHSLSLPSGWCGAVIYLRERPCLLKHIHRLLAPVLLSWGSRGVSAAHWGPCRDTALWVWGPHGPMACHPQPRGHPWTPSRGQLWPASCLGEAAPDLGAGGSGQRQPLWRCVQPVGGLHQSPLSLLPLPLPAPVLSAQKTLPQLPCLPVIPAPRPPTSLP